MKCENCGYQRVPEDAKFCPNCGEELKNKHFHLLKFWHVDKDSYYGGYYTYNIVNDKGQLIRLRSCYSIRTYEDYGRQLSYYDGTTWRSIDDEGNQIGGYPNGLNHIGPLCEDMIASNGHYNEEDDYDEDFLYAGFFNKLGNIVIPFEYNAAENFSNGYAAVMKNPTRGHYLSEFKWGYINKNGKLIIPLMFEEAKPFYVGCAWVKYQGKWGIISGKGEFILRPEYDEVKDFTNNGLTAVCKKGSWGFVNCMGKIIIPIIYRDVRSFSEGLACVQNKENKCYFIDEKGVKALEIPFDSNRDFHGGRLVVESTNRNEKGFYTYGVVDTKGRLIVPTGIYTNIEDYDENGFAQVQIYGKCGYINKQGKVIIPCEYVALDKFRHGLICGTIKEKSFMFDMKGNRTEFYIKK